MKDDELEASADLEDKLDAAPAALDAPRVKAKGKPIAGAALFLHIPTNDILPSPFNHRKTFNGIDELAASIKEKGVINPITVRPAPPTRSHPPYELVAGERRWRACKVAGLELVPCIVRQLSDKEVLEIQLIENVQRADVHPLEEADGYQDLIKKHGYDVDTIAAKTGKSRGYVYARLKLCDLGKEARKAFLEGRLNPSVALMIARLDPKLQDQAAKEVLGAGDWKAYQKSNIHPRQISGDEEELDEEEFDAGKEPNGQPLSVREASLHLQRKYMLRLDQASFDVADATLVAKAGACTACPHRSGNQRELFSDIKSADVCTQPACFESKKAADWTRKSTTAAKTGLRVLNEKEAKNVFESHGDGTRIAYSSAYVDPNDDLPHDMRTPKRSTWKDLIKETAAPAIAKVVAKDGASSARVLWDKKSAIAVATKSGSLKEAKAESAARKQEPDQYTLANRKREADAKRRHRVGRAAFELIGAAKIDLKDPEVWRYLAHAILRMLDSEDCRNLCKRRELEDIKMGSGGAEKALRAIVTAAKVTDLPGLVLEFSAAYRAIGGPWAGSDGYGDNFKDACKLVDVDLGKLKAKLAAEEKAKAATKAKKPAAKKGRK